MKKALLIFMLIVLVMAANGCSNPAPPPSKLSDQNGTKTESAPTPPDIVAPGQSIPSLGGIRLGMTMEDATGLLGNTYTDRLEEEGGYFSESIIIRHYPNGCDLVIGQTSRKVLQIDVFSPAYPTNLGIKVGDPSIAAIQMYRDKYPEYVGNQSSEKLPGWFLVDPGTLLIFSSQENHDRNNRNLNEESRIQAITLGSIRYFD